MKKIITIVAIIVAFSLVGCNSEAKEKQKEQVQQAADLNEGVGQSTPVQGPIVIPEKGKYKY